MNCECGKPAKLKGMCRNCYMRARRAADLEPRRRDWVADTHRYPFSELEALLPAELLWEDTLGVAHQQVHVWRKRGLSWRTADRLACRIGIHPGLIWTDWFERGYMDGRMEQEESAA